MLMYDGLGDMLGDEAGPLATFSCFDMMGGAKYND
jgi:hypothetical protein